MRDGGAGADHTHGCRQELTIDDFRAGQFDTDADLLDGPRDHSELADDTMVELRLLAEAIAGVVPSLCGVLLTVTAAGVDATVRLAVNNDNEDGTVVASSLRLPLSASSGDGMVVLQASTPQAFDELARDATVLLPDGGLGVVVDRHLTRTPAITSAGDAVLTASADSAGGLASALSDASLVNQALGALLGQGYLPTDAAAELDRRAAEADVSRVAVAAEVLDALTKRGRGDGAGGPPSAPRWAGPDRS